MSIIHDLYKLYPIHLGRGAALKHIEKALKRLRMELLDEGLVVGDETEWLKERVSAFAESDAGKKDGLFDGYTPPYPATWFHQQRYLDDQDNWHKKTRDIYAEFLAKGAGQ